MSIYATIADLRARVAEDELIQLTDDANTGIADEAHITDALVQADNQINGYVAALYKRVDASAPVPGLLTDIACDLAHFRLFRRGSPTEAVEKKHSKAVSQLRDIAKGVIKLDLGEETLVARDDMIIVQSSDRVFTRDSMGGY